MTDAKDDSEDKPFKCKQCKEVGVGHDSAFHANYIY